MPGRKARASRGRGRQKGTERKWSLKSSREEEFYNEENAESLKLCSECGKEGDLGQCSMCPRYFHPSCARPRFFKSSRRKWACYHCKEIPYSVVESSHVVTRRKLRRMESEKHCSEATSDASEDSNYSYDGPGMRNRSEDEDVRSEASEEAEPDEMTSVSFERAKACQLLVSVSSAAARKFCKVCKRPGSLLECYSCKFFFHVECFQPAIVQFTTEKILCFICETKKPENLPRKILWWKYVNVMPTKTQLSYGAESKPYRTRMFYVKFQGCSYWECDWIFENYLRYYHWTTYQSYIKREGLDVPPTVEYGYDEPDNEIPDPNEEMDASNLENRFYRYGIEPSWMEIDRILDVRLRHGKRMYLVKWCDSYYDELSWEWLDAPHLKAIQSEFVAAIERFDNHRGKLRECPIATKNENNRKYIKYDCDPPFIPDKLSLKYYQLEGLNWLLHSWHNRRCVILADEMGLGKTIQTICFLNALVHEKACTGPFLITVPLTTIPNWEREFSVWAPELYVVVLAGPKKSRKLVFDYDFYYRFEDKANEDSKGECRFHVLLTSFEMINVEKNILKNIEWEVLIVDEAHRLKNAHCKLFKYLLMYNVQYKVLLTGTPLQNNLEELYHLLQFVSPTEFVEKENFLRLFARISKEEQITQLREILGPRLLRRLKRDVLKDIPWKSEKLILLDLSDLQKQYYRAILTKNYSQFVNKTSTAASLTNIAMELRKCCNHPYLFPAAFDKATKDENGNLILSELEDAGCKLPIMGRMLEKLKNGSHQVLIFSQMTKLLDILEEFLDLRGWNYERIDGSVACRDRQSAIDRFNAPDSDAFCFLLSTRAGAHGINLASADTVFIYDSDWNPHNDIQALSRAHRLGQKNNVLIFRFVCRNTIEEKIIQVSKEKLLLTHLVIKSGGADGSSRLTKRELDDILRFGTNKLFEEDDNVGRITYSNSELDELLDRSKITESNDQNYLQEELFSSFKVAKYGVDDGSQSPSHSNYNHKLDIQDSNYWERLLRKYIEPEEEGTPPSELGKGKRIKNRVVYSGADVAALEQDSEFSMSDISNVTTTTESDVDEFIIPDEEVEINSFSRKRAPCADWLTDVENQLSSQVIASINKSILKFGVPPDEFTTRAYRWSKEGLKLKSMIPFKAYVHTLMENMIARYRPGIPVIIPLSIINNATCIPPGGSQPNVDQSAHAAARAQLQQYTELTLENTAVRMYTMELIRDKVYEYMRFASYLYPILVDEELIPVDKLVYKYPDCVLLNRRDGTNKDKYEIYDPSVGSMGYKYPATIEEILRINCELCLNIEDSGITDLHHVWEMEEEKTVKTIWWRLHDMYLLLGTAVHGYARFREIICDPRFHMLRDPFVNDDDTGKMRLFLLRRFKVLEQALLAERVFKMCKKFNIYVWKPEHLKTIEKYHELKNLIEGTGNILRNAVTGEKDAAMSAFTILTYARELITYISNDISKLQSRPFPPHMSQLCQLGLKSPTDLTIELRGYRNSLLGRKDW